jgi:hypothetical protein
MRLRLPGRPQCSGIRDAEERSIAIKSGNVRKKSSILIQEEIPEEIATGEAFHLYNIGGLNPCIPVFCKDATSALEHLPGFNS